MTKKRVGRYPKEFRRMAVERLKGCDNIVALARELGVHRRLLYKWRDQLEPMEDFEGALLPNSRVAALRKEISQLRRVLADKVVEVDFFRGALHKVEARRQRRESSGEKAPTTRSESYAWRSTSARRVRTRNYDIFVDAVWCPPDAACAL